MPIWFQALVILTLVLALARLIKRHAPLFQRFFIPSSIIGGVLFLVFGPQGTGLIPAEITDFLAVLPALLINVVFAGLFIGKKVPKPRQVWKQAGSMIAFGSTIAWGMYVLAGLLVLFLLGPLFGAPPAFGALLEISFSGGHGTAAGLAPTFAGLGWPEATDIALGLATVSIISAVIIGIIVINVYNRRMGRVVDRNTMRLQQQRMARRGYSLTHLTRSLEERPINYLSAALSIGSAIGIGWLILQGLIWLEGMLLPSGALRVFVHMPLFTFVLFGGLLVQLILKSFNWQRLVDVRLVQTFGSIALDLLIITAIGTVSLSVITHNAAAFTILAVAGVAWVLVAFFVLAPRMFQKYWFEYGMTDLGQALGTTATGLLLNRLADPLNRTGARETFAYKQLAYEPLMGGGIVTATAAVAVVEFGLVPVVLVSAVVWLFWIVVGLRLGSKRRRSQRHWQLIGRQASRL